MNEMSRPQGKVTIEDLIRLKRCERPPVEFWADFDRQMREKQLAAIVKKRPSVWSWSRVWLTRVGVPIGAAAAFAFAFVTVKQHRSSGSEAVTAVPLHSSAPVATQSDRSQSNADLAQTREEAPALPSRSEAYAQADAAPSSTVEDSTDRGSALDTADTSKQMATDENNSSSSRPDRSDFIAPGLSMASARAGMMAASETSEPEFIQALQRSGVEVRPLPGKVPSVEPLTQVTTPKDARRAKLLAYISSSAGHSSEASGALRSRERITSHLQEQALYDSISRLGLNADRVSIKF
jgi:hypothetical protein